MCVLNRMLRELDQEGSILVRRGSAEGRALGAITAERDALLKAARDALAILDYHRLDSAAVEAVRVAVLAQDIKTAAEIKEVAA